MPRDQNDDTFDDLFEPFELDEYVDEPSETQAPPRPQPPPEGPERHAPPVATIRCPSCGADNPEHNRHCEQCGARVSQGPLPVAPPPMMRATPGARALTVLAGIVILVVVVAAVLNFLGDDDGETAISPEEVTTTAGESTETTLTPDAQSELVPASVEASSELAGFEAENLMDDDVGTYWNDSSQRGVGAVLTFNFAQPVTITEMELVNIPDDTSFRRNYRIRDLQIAVDDLQVEIPWKMPDNNEPERIPLNTIETRRVTLTVLSTYVGEPVDDNPSFTELALAEVRFYGSVNESVSESPAN